MTTKDMQNAFEAESSRAFTEHMPFLRESNGDYFNLSVQQDWVLWQKAWQAATQSVQSEGGWMDIASAPRDGTQIMTIGFNGGDVKYGYHQLMVFWSKGYWVCVAAETTTDEDYDEDRYRLHCPYLTHWQPLPAAPGQHAKPVSLWTKCSERLPTADDVDEHGYLWLCGPNINGVQKGYVIIGEPLSDGIQWHPKPKSQKPNPPKEM